MILSSGHGTPVRLYFMFEIEVVSGQQVSEICAKIPMDRLADG